MTWKLSNFAESTLSQAIADSDTTIYIDATEVDDLPTLGVGDKAKLVIFNNSAVEVVNITAWNTNGTLTVERAQESTAARAWAAGTKVVHTPTAEILQAVLDATVQAVYRGAATGTNDITVTGSGSSPIPTDGDEVSFEVAATNTGAVTVTYTNGVSSVGPFALVNQAREPLSEGDLTAGYRVNIVYDASSGHWVLATQGSRNYQISEINTGPLDAENLLINGGFDAWYNGTSFATPASGSVTADNVVAEYNGTIGAFTVARQTFTVGQTDVPGGPRHYLRWDQSSAGSASTYRRLRMKLPHVGKYALEVLVASLYMMADSSRNVTARLIQSFGTGGLPSAEVILASEVWALTTSWTRFDISSQIASIAGKTLGSNGDDGLLLELSLPVNTSMTIDMAMGQVEFGSVATKPHAKYPVSFEQGGTGHSFVSMLALATALSLSAGTWLTQASFDAANTDLAAFEAFSGTGLVARTAPNTYAARSIVVPSGLSITNADGISGNPTLALGTAFANYLADPMSPTELASITGAFGTAAFVADSGLVHITGTETVSGAKTFSAIGTFNADINLATGTDNYVYYDGALHLAQNGVGDALTIATTTRVVTVATNLAVSGVSLAAAGAVGTPSYSFLGDPDTGFYNGTANAVYVANGGVLGWTITATAFSAQAGGLIQAGAGSAAFPAFAFTGDTNTGMYQIGADNLGLGTGGSLRLDINGTRVLVTGGDDLVLGAAAVSPTSVYSVGYRGSPINTQNTAYTFVLSDAGCTIYHDEVTARTYTIPANSSVAFPVGTVIVIDNTGNSGSAGAITLSITTDTLRRADGVSGTGSRTIPANGKVTIQKTKTTEWTIVGAFS